MEDEFTSNEFADDDDHYEPEEWSDDESVELVECSHCGAEVYEEAPQCPVCGNYMVVSTSAMSGKPLWFVLLGLAGIVAVVLALSGLASLMG